MGYFHDEALGFDRGVVVVNQAPLVEDEGRVLVEEPLAVPFKVDVLWFLVFCVLVLALDEPERLGVEIPDFLRSFDDEAEGRKLAGAVAEVLIWWGYLIGDGSQLYLACRESVWNLVKEAPIRKSTSWRISTACN